MGKGKSTAEASGVADCSYLCWRRLLGELKVDRPERLRDLDAEDSRLMRVVAEPILGKVI